MANNKSGSRYEHSILMEGVEISESLSLKSLIIFKEVNRISGAMLFLSDGDVAKGVFSKSNSLSFRPGRELEIQLGSVSDKQTVFKGVIVRQGIQHLQGAPSVLKVELKHDAVKMTHSRQNAYYEGLTDKEIMEGLGTGTLSVEADNSLQVSHPELLQVNVCDWDYLVSRAEVNGCFVYTNQAGLVEVRPPLINSLEDNTVVRYGFNVQEFEFEMDARNQYKSVEAFSWDFAGQSEISGEAESVPGVVETGDSISSDELAEIFGDGTYSLYHSGRVTGETELRNWAQAKLIKSRLSKTCGKVVISGTAEVQPGDTVSLEGFGDLYNGEVFVSGVLQKYENGLWTTEINFGVSPKWFVSEHDVADSPVSGFTPALQGVQTAKVTEISGDPEGQARVKVRINILHDETISIWARVAQPDAGANRGVFFRPRIGDEVLVTFVNQDPRDVVIIGSLHSADSLAPPFEHDEFARQGIVTESGHKLEFDDEKNIITLTSPGGNVLVIDDDEGKIEIRDESNKNAIVMDSNGISLTSKGDIVLKTSAGDISLEGMNIKQKANGKFKAEGTGGAELSSTANAVIKGSVVQIN